MRCLSKVLAPYFALAFLVPAATCLSREELKSSNASNPTATIDSGVVTGKVTHIPGSGSPVNQFLGIPFAQPPVGDLRFAPPEKPHAWNRTYNAAAQPPACIQDFGNRTTGSDFQKALYNTPPPPGESEDCLYLNVYAPSYGGKDKPVLFWIYGGAFRFGASSLPLYDGTSFAANQDIIVVAANYRTNRELRHQVFSNNTDLFPTQCLAFLDHLSSCSMHKILAN